MQTYLSCSSSADTYIRLIHICLSLSSSLNVFIILNVFSKSITLIQVWTHLSHSSIVNKSITLIQCKQIYHVHPAQIPLSHSFSANIFIAFIKWRQIYHTYPVQTHLLFSLNVNWYITLTKCEKTYRTHKARTSFCDKHVHSLNADVFLTPIEFKLIHHTHPVAPSGDSDCVFAYLVKKTFEESVTLAQSSNIKVTDASQVSSSERYI